MITISIVSHAQNAMVNRLLADLAVIEAQVVYDIIVTENILDEVEIIHDAAGKNVRIIRNANPQSYARNHNNAFKEAAGDCFCVLNPDVRWVQPVFTKLLAHIENSAAEIIAPLVLDTLGVVQDSFRHFPTPGDLFQRRVLHRGLEPMAFVRGEFARPDWIAGIFMLMPAAAYRGLGGFDEGYRMYFEDVDFCARARLAGKRIGVDTNVAVHHEAHRSSQKSWKYFLWHSLSAVRFFTSPVYRQLHRLSNETG
jgi:N-acetylglucosaminyl-diphospho-decaprenol L-rhamnosyltransferase